MCRKIIHHLTINLLAVDGPVIVGEGGTVLKHDGGNWVPAGVTWDDRLNSVWYGGNNNIWVVGDEATVFHFGGTDGYLLRSP